MQSIDTCTLSRVKVRGGRQGPHNAAPGGAAVATLPPRRWHRRSVPTQTPAFVRHVIERSYQPPPGKRVPRGDQKIAITEIGRAHV